MIFCVFSLFIFLLFCVCGLYNYDYDDNGPKCPRSWANFDINALKHLLLARLFQSIIIIIIIVVVVNICGGGDSGRNSGGEVGKMQNKIIHQSVNFY